MPRKAASPARRAPAARSRRTASEPAEQGAGAVAGMVSLTGQGATEAPLPATLRLAAFGQSLELQAPPDRFLREDSLWRLREIHERALAARTLEPEGVALDIGAGFGAFALPFARAFPGWMVWCFEPEPEAHAALAANIEALGLDNVVALPLAVGAAGPEASADGPAGIDLMALGAAIEAGDRAGLERLCPPRPHARSRSQRAFLQALPDPDSAVPEGFEPCSLPTLPASALAALQPRLLKLTAPQAEAAILGALAGAELDHIIGEMWTVPPSRLLHGPGLRQTWLPVAGAPMLTLRRSAEPGARRPGLDVVVAMYNARAWIGDCIEGLRAGASDEIRLLVVDDGSTDGSAELLRELYGETPQIRLLSKPNGGCASARNFGRLHSDASHIAFVDADDVPGPHLFSELLELARYTGAEMVQGGFEMLHAEPGGGLRREPSYEEGLPVFLEARRHPFGRGRCLTLPAAALIAGQPTIWRRVYRRDFLDNRKIWFPEHIRAFDDQIFQLLTLQHAGSVPMLEHVRYGYRQHPDQDIRQGDARGFYSLEMVRLVLKRALAEGWNDLHPFLISFVNTVNWTHAGLHPELRPRFARAAAEFWVILHKALGPGPFHDLPDRLLQLPDIGQHLADHRARLDGFDTSWAFACLDSADMHVQMVRARQTLRR